MGARAQGEFGAYTSSHCDAIICPKCGNRGSIAWDDIAAPDGDRKELIGITGGFYERLSKKAPYPIELVCNNCGTSEPDPVQEP